MVASLETQLEDIWRNALYNVNYHEAYRRETEARLSGYRLVAPILSWLTALCSGLALAAGPGWSIAALVLSGSAGALYMFETARNLRERAHELRTLRRRWARLEGEAELLLHRMRRGEVVAGLEVDVLRAKANDLELDNAPEVESLAKTAWDATLRQLGLASARTGEIGPRAIASVDGRPETAAAAT